MGDNMFNLGKKARKNLVGLLRSFNLQAAKVNKLYADEPNFQPVPTYTIDEFMSNVNSKSDYRRETDRLKRFFKKNRADAQKQLYVLVDGEIYTVVNWMFKEQRNIRRAETAKRNRVRKFVEQYESEEDYRLPPEVPSTPTTENFKGQQQQYADSALDRLVQNYINALYDNGYAQTEAGMKVINIVKILYERFNRYLEAILWGGGEGDGAIDFLYATGGNGDSGPAGYIHYANISFDAKTERLLNYWYKRLEESGVDLSFEYGRSVELGINKKLV